MNIDFFDREIILENDIALLRPMQPDDFEDFKLIAFEKDIWTYTLSRVYDEFELQDYMLKAFRDREIGTRYTFTIIDKATGNIAGSSSYLNIFLNDLRLEIGFTWLGAPYRRTGLNRACKQLLLQYAFEILGMQRVEFKTDSLNMRSRNALKGIGAIEEGILRSHSTRHDGYRRDSVYFSIIRKDWDAMKK